MSRIRITFQIALCLAVLSTTALIVAETVGMLPNHDRAALEARLSICESLAVYCSQLVNLHATKAIEANLRHVAARNPELLSAALRQTDGTLVASVGDHATHWTGNPGRKSSDSQVYVPIVQGTQEWGVLEVSFKPLRMSGWLAYIDFSFWRLMAFTTAVNGLIFVYYLRKVLYELDPQRSMPQRVRSALDTLVEGLLVLDNKGRIVMANRAFAAIAGQTPEQLQGQTASALPWVHGETIEIPPWEDVLESKQERAGVSLSLTNSQNEQRSFVVNAAPILDAKGSSRGVLASFDDVTALENKKRELMHMLAVLQESRERITRQNEELKYLATRDPMTGCLNRRSFFEQFEALWEMQGERNQDLGCIMVDVDHFKSINDNFGHSTGDEVLKKVASALLSAVNTSGVVCRFGGEEFCIVMPGCDINIVEEAAERFREAIAALKFPQLTVTASLGVSANKLGAQSPQGMLEEADKSLYYSKRNGRNRVSRYDRVPVDFEVSETKTRKRETPAEPALPEVQVPFQAVTSLMAALSYRDPATAGHCQRVADLAVATSRGLMTAREAYLLEIAALLHDIGKIGVPDAILLKAGPLTRDEWELMRLNTRMGVEIVNASFQSPALNDMVRFHHCRFEGDTLAPQLPKREAIPLGARLIAICDAYDSMTTNHVYRKGRTRDEAFGELIKMSGTQFDPQLVQRFMEVVSSRSERQEMSTTELSQELAMNLGMQSERLARAIDEQDSGTVKALATHLEATAAKHGVEDIRLAANRLVQLTEKDTDLNLMVQSMYEIIDLSLEAQKAALRPSSELVEAVETRKRLAGQ
jgi:diguanylate cyclase (GGDEF)-like protein/PAS domain S-box-containing protein